MKLNNTPYWGKLICKSCKIEIDLHSRPDMQMVQIEIFQIIHKEEHEVVYVPYQKEVRIETQKS